MRTETSVCPFVRFVYVGHGLKNWQRLYKFFYFEYKKILNPAVYMLK